MIVAGLRWFLGLNVLLLLGAALFEGWPAAAAALYVLAAAILLPPIGARLSTYLRPLERPWIALVAGFVFCIVGAAMTPVSTKTEGKVVAATPSVHSNKPTDVASQARPAPAQPPKQVAEPAKKPEVVDIRTKIHPDAAAPIQGPSWAKTIQDWGDDWIRRINAALPRVAEKIARSPACDYVEVIGISNRSTVRQNAIFYVDCRNRERFYVSEAELGSAAAPASKNAKTAGIIDAVAITACVEQVKDQLKLPLSFDRHVLSTKVYRSPYGNISVDFDFTAKNALGGSIPQHARCAIDDTGIYPAEISAR